MLFRKHKIMDKIGAARLAAFHMKRMSWARAFATESFLCAAQNIYQGSSPEPAIQSAKKKLAEAEEEEKANDYPVLSDEAKQHVVNELDAALAAVLEAELPPEKEGPMCSLIRVATAVYFGISLEKLRAEDERDGFLQQWPPGL
jgi:hypothetical protein